MSRVPVVGPEGLDSAPKETYEQQPLTVRLVTRSALYESSAACSTRELLLQLKANRFYQRYLGWPSSWFLSQRVLRVPPRLASK